MYKNTFEIYKHPSGDDDFIIFSLGSCSCELLLLLQLLGDGYYGSFERKITESVFEMFNTS